ncbi:MAG: ATP-binding cassette domain-containing protein [Kiritimatiellae bacterium]|nr:ATP-binding cassette domain-containing protein [Kiritimatiellia bacterium]
MNLIKNIKQSNLIQNYSKFFPYVKPYLWQAILAILVTLPLGAMDAVIAWVLKPYTDVVMIERSAKATSFLPLLVIIFSFAQSFLNYAATYLNTWVGQKITMDLKLSLFKKLMRYDPRFFDKSTSGVIIYKFNHDAEMASSGLLANLKVFTTRLFSSISLIVVLIYNSWQLSIIAIVILFGALYPLTKVRKKIKGIMDKTIFSGAQVMTHYNEAFSGNRVISSFNLYEYQEKRFSNTLQSVFKLGMNMTKKTGIVSPMMHFIVSIGIAGVIWLGGWLISHNQLTPGGFVSFITALLMLYHPIKSIGSNYTNVQMSLLAMERVFSSLESKPSIKNKDTAIKLEDIKSDIVFENVCFEYDANRPILKNVSLKIAKGQTVAFVGNSGGGKTTLVNLLPRFYDVKKGAVKIDGHDVRDIDIDSLRNMISIVFQDNILFSGTIRDNILLGKTSATNEEIWKAVKSACLEEFISSLPLGLDTEIGERGTKLSGGQKQRVAIARAFLKNAPIVILDEATSALDNKSEEIVQQAIYNLMEDRTVFVIAHRLSTVKNADNIVVIDHGQIREQGTHEELLKKEDSVYAKLYKTQLK